MTRDDRLRIAVFIDFDNIEIGVKNTLGSSFDAGLVLEALRERGDVVSKTAYSDWQRAGNYSRMLTQHAIKMVQRNLTPGGDKNGADINLALDALEMAFTHPHINAFVIVGGDSDFISLVEKLKQYDKKVFVVGGRQFTSIIMQRNCHEFIAYENLAATPPAGAAVQAAGRRPQGGRAGVRVERTPIEQAIPLVTRALQVLSDREVAPQMGLLKTTLLQLDSTFSERDYGAGSFRDFVMKLEKIGLVTLHQGKGGLLVGPGEYKPAASETTVEEPGAAGEGVEAPVSAAVTPEGTAPAAPVNGSPTPAPAVTGTNAEGVAELTRLLASGQVRRWPMYLRNVKQFLKQVAPEFDERAYGFMSLVDLLRAAGRDGIVRVDRDRQGVIRVFQGSGMPGTAAASATTRAADVLPPTNVSDVVIGEIVPIVEPATGQGQVVDGEMVGPEVVPVIDIAAAPVSAAGVPEFEEEDPDDSIGNRLAPGETREEFQLRMRRGAPTTPSTPARRQPTGRRPNAGAPAATRRRPAGAAADRPSREPAGAKRAPRARKPRRG